MKCDRCEHEATVHEVTIRSGVKVEKHLCQDCASAEGLAPAAASPVEVLKAAIEAAQISAAGEAPSRRASGKQQACGSCGMTWDEFKSGGMLGCPRCYDEFEGRLIPLIERAHEGASQHVGKSPRRASGQSEGSKARALAALVEERAQRASALRRLLEEAVKSEQYERAAQIRDDLKRLTGGPAGQE